jgi:hypothetical protein
MKADHLRNLNSFTLPKFGKYQLKTFLNHFPSELQMYHTPLTWYEQENLGHTAHIEALPPALWFLRLYYFKNGFQRQCASVPQDGARVHKPITQRF